MPIARAKPVAISSVKYDIASLPLAMDIVKKLLENCTSKQGKLGLAIYC
jgi:hypothetical protein